MVRTFAWVVSRNWACSGGIVTAWNLAPLPSTAMSRLPACASRHRALIWSARSCLMSWSEVSTPLGMADWPKNLAAYFSAPRPRPMAWRAWPIGDSPSTWPGVVKALTCQMLAGSTSWPWIR
jgi:hypothetical protein